MKTDYSHIMAKGKVILLGVAIYTVRGNGEFRQGGTHFVIKEHADTQENSQDDPFIQVRSGVKGDQKGEEANDPVGEKDPKDTFHFLNVHKPEHGIHHHGG